jgi:hypothetical protein
MEMLNDSRDMLSVDKLDRGTLNLDVVENRYVATKQNLQILAEMLGRAIRKIQVEIMVPEKLSEELKKQMSVYLFGLIHEIKDSIADIADHTVSVLDALDVVKDYKGEHINLVRDLIKETFEMIKSTERLIDKTNALMIASGPLMDLNDYENLANGLAAVNKNFVNAKTVFETSTRAQVIKLPKSNLRLIVDNTKK